MPFFTIELAKIKMLKAVLASVWEACNIIYFISVLGGAAFLENNLAMALKFFNTQPFDPFHL